MHQLEVMPVSKQAVGKGLLSWQDQAAPLAAVGKIKLASQANAAVAFWYSLTNMLCVIHSQMDDRGALAELIAALTAQDHELFGAPELCRSQHKTYKAQECYLEFLSVCFLQQRCLVLPAGAFSVVHALDEQIHLLCLLNACLVFFF